MQICCTCMDYCFRRLFMIEENQVKLYDTGRQDCSDLHSYGPAVHFQYVIHYIIKGSGYLDYDNKHYHIKTGESFLIYPFTICHYYPDPDDPWTYTWLNFAGKATPLYLKNCRMSREAPVCPFIPQEKIMPLFDRLQSLDIYLANNHEAHGLLLAMLGIYSDVFPAISQSTSSQEDNRLAAAVTMIKSNYRFDWFNVEALCRMMHCSRVTLYRLFQNGLNVSPGTYLSRYRIKQAARMLEMGISVKTAAVSCGYSDQFYFSRAFKQQMGVAPSEYKEQKRIQQ